MPESGAWAACSDAVLVQFVPDMMRSYHQLLVPLLENGVKVSRRSVALMGGADACDLMVNWSTFLHGRRSLGGRRRVCHVHCL